MKTLRFSMVAGTVCMAVLGLAACHSVSLKGDPDRAPLSFVSVSSDTARTQQEIARAVAAAVQENSGFRLVTRPTRGSIQEFRGVYARAPSADEVIVTYGHGVYSGQPDADLAGYLASQSQTATTFRVTVSTSGNEVTLHIAPRARLNRIAGPVGADLPAVSSTEVLANDLQSVLADFVQKRQTLGG